MHKRDEVLIGDVFLSWTFPGKHLQVENTALRSDGPNPLASVLLFKEGTELFLIGSGPVEDVGWHKPPIGVGPLIQRLLAKGLILFPGYCSSCCIEAFLSGWIPAVCGPPARLRYVPSVVVAPLEDPDERGELDQGLG